jgi:high-affinity Fe2+/Pb2+ permease
METGPTVTGEVPSGATMQPRYMGRIMNTYPVSEPEMEMISSLAAQETILYSMATLLLGLATSIWVGALFADKLKPEGTLACEFVAPLLMFFAAASALFGFLSHRKKNNKWEALKRESIPMQAIAPAGPTV